MSLDIALAISGVAASAVGAIVAAVSKSFVERRHKAERQQIEEAANVRLTEIGFHVAGLGVTFKVPPRAGTESTVSEKLLKDVEQGIVDVVATREGLSRVEVGQEVESKMQEVRGRIEAIEKRFPSDATIDKISSINDALFAQRVEQLSERLAKLEEKTLTRWDVALTVSVMVGGVFAVVGATYAVLKSLGHVS
jgi:hypothetical protein